MVPAVAEPEPPTGKGAPAPPGAGPRHRGPDPTGSQSDEDDAEEGEEEEEAATDPPVAAPAPTAPAPTAPAPTAPAPKDPRSGSVRPPEPECPPTSTASAPAEKTGSKPSKDSQYTCKVCGRVVGGGVAGSWQHRRSAYHLSCWIYWNNKEKRAWKLCQDDAQKWSKQLWAKNETGPEDDTLLQKPGKKQWSPVPVRSDPDRKRRDKDGQGDPEPDSGAGSSTDNLLVKMWQATVRELGR